MTFDPPRLELLGLRFVAHDAARGAQLLLSAARERRPLAATALAVHGLMVAHDDPQLSSMLGHVYVFPDSQPIRWALNLLHGAGLTATAGGPELMDLLLAEAARTGLRVYFYGSTPRTLGRLTERMQARHPGLIIAAATPSRFAPLDGAAQAQLAAELRAAEPHLVLVGLGCPRQEVFAYTFGPQVGCPVVAVGAAFDFHAGTVPRAPRWVNQGGLEWAFRLALEPRRLWRRYLLLNPRFVAGVVRTWIVGHEGTSPRAPGPWRAPAHCPG